MPLKSRIRGRLKCINFSKKLQFTSQYNYTGGFQLGEDDIKVAVRHVAPQFGNAHLIWELKKLKLDAYTNYNGQFDYADLELFH